MLSFKRGLCFTDVTKLAILKECVCKDVPNKSQFVCKLHFLLTMSQYFDEMMSYNYKEMNFSKPYMC